MSQDHETSIAWQLFSYNWVVLGLMALALALTLPLTGFSLKLMSLMEPVGIAAIYSGTAYYNLFWRAQKNPTVIFILGSTGQILLIPILMTPMTYIAASANLPLQDKNLMALDQALGLDWVAYFNFFYHHYALLYASVVGYSMIGWPVFGIPIVLAFTRHYRRLQEFTLAFALALITTTAISAFTPAMGTYDWLHYLPNPDIFTPGAYLEQLRDLPMVRDGSLRHLELMQLAGIVTFPSFHAAAAVLYLWAFWAVRWMRPFALLANIAMLIATPVCGGHYFVDVFAGIAIAAVSVVAARRIADWLTRTSAVVPSYVQGAAISAEGG
jgi:PAP2 superfamily